MVCIFCNSDNHDISNCNEEMICHLFEYMKKMFTDIIELFPVNFETSFKAAINRRYTTREILSVGFKILGASSTSSKTEIINLIWEYFNERIQHPRDILETIHDYEANPEITPEVLEDENSVFRGQAWYIDRTPTYSNNLNNDINAEQNNDNILRHNIKTSLVVEEPNLREERICSICLEDNINYNKFVKLNCLHQFCEDCIEKILIFQKENSHPKCALCRLKITSLNVKKEDIYNKMKLYCN